MEKMFLAGLDCYNFFICFYSGSLSQIFDPLFLVSLKNSPVPLKICVLAEQMTQKDVKTKINA
jgi:hypothetical protein